MSDVRCPACGATNPDRATWCNQCLVDFNAHAPADASGEAGGRPRTGEVVTASRVTATAGPAGTTDDDGFRRRDGVVEWRCPTCELWMPIDAAVCAGCRTSLPTRMQAGRASAPVPSIAAGSDRTRTRRRIVLLNAVLPGLGHLLAGWVGSGLARIVLFAVWCVGGLLLAAAGGPVTALPLLLGAAVLWLASLYDGWQVADGGLQVLTGRALLWLVVGVTVFATLGVVAAALGPAGG